MVEESRMKKINLFLIMLMLCKLTFSELILNSSNLSPSKYEVFNLEVSFVNEDKEKIQNRWFRKF